MSNFLDVPTNSQPSKVASMLSGVGGVDKSTSSTSSSSAGSKKKIVVIDDSGSDSGSDSDSDAPPPILGEGLKMKELDSADKSPAPAVAKEEDDGPTLMEQMMAEAAIAKKEADEKKAALERKKAKKFGGGLKGGFFDKPKKSKKKKGGAKAAPNPKKVEEKKEEEVEEVFELSPDGEMIPTITKPKGPAKSSLVFDEVQESMKAPGVISGDNSKEWATASLMEKISKNPRLAVGLANPRFMQAIEDMKRDPEAAQKKYKGNKEIEDFITEFAGVMGEHFNELGAKKESEEKKNKKAEQQQQPMGPDIGPLAEQALKRQKEREAKGEVGWDDSASQAEVDKIIGNQELASILMDPEMQRVLQECAIPGKMNKFMNDKTWGPKIKLLIDNGLIKIER